MELRRTIFADRVGDAYMSQKRNTPDCDFCAGTAPSQPVDWSGIFLLGLLIGLQLESLILAQNERWRHA